jgi:hypothetical protein
LQPLTSTDHQTLGDLVQRIDRRLNELDAELQHRHALILEYQRMKAARAVLTGAKSSPRVRTSPHTRRYAKSRSVSEESYQAAIAGRETELKALFLELKREDEVADRTGIDSALIRHFADENIPDAALLRRRRKRREAHYSDEELLRCLQQGSRELRSPLSHLAYGGWARGRQLKDHRPWPGPQAAMLRFGSWRAALTQAGLPANPTAGPQKTFQLDDCIEAVAQAWRETERPPSVGRYERWRLDKSAETRGRIPSAPTVRNAIRRLSQGWDDLLLTVYPLVHGHKLRQ